MPPHLFNLIPEHQTPYESFMDVYSVFHDNSGFGPKMILDSQTWKHTHKLPKHDTTKHRYELSKKKNKQELNTRLDNLK